MAFTKNFNPDAPVNQFRIGFLKQLSELAFKHHWNSSLGVSTNEEQNTFFFSHLLKSETPSLIETVSKDIEEALHFMRQNDWIFTQKITKKAHSFNITNIRHS